MLTVLELKEPPNVSFIKPAMDSTSEAFEQHLRDLICQAEANIEIEKYSFQEIHNVKAVLEEHKYGIFYVRITGLMTHAHFYLVRTPREITSNFRNELARG